VTIEWVRGLLFVGVVGYQSRSALWASSWSVGSSMSSDLSRRGGEETAGVTPSIALPLPSRKPLSYQPLRR